MIILSKLIILFLVLSCQSISSDSTNYFVDKNKEKSIKSKNGMVATAHPLASKAGIEALEKGGNAVDAMVASSFVISVVRPQSTGIGGGGFALSYHEKSKTTRVFDFETPLGATRNMFLDKENKKSLYKKNVLIGPESLNGALSVGTPGLVAGLFNIHKEYET